MITVSVDFKDSKAKNKWRTIGENFTPQMRNSMNAIKRMLKNDLYMMSPVGRTGMLRESFHLNLTNTRDGGHELKISNSMPYFSYVHEGTQPHDIPVHYKSSTVGGITTTQYRIIKHPGISRTPMPWQKGVQPFVTRILHVRQKLMAETLKNGIVELIKTGKARDLNHIPYFSFTGSLATYNAHGGTYTYNRARPSRYVYTYKEGFKRRANLNKRKANKIERDEYEERTSEGEQ
jgi:hypothetical protein